MKNGEGNFSLLEGARCPSFFIISFSCFGYSVAPFLHSARMSDAQKKHHGRRKQNILFSARSKTTIRAILFEKR